jgi:hypothetical protein
VNDLFEGELTEDDKLVYVNNVIKGKLLESDVLVQQASNTKEQFSNSPDLANGILNAIMDTFAARSTMSKQALESEKLRSGFLKDVLLGPAQLYESLRAKGGGPRNYQVFKGSRSCASGQSRAMRRGNGGNFGNGGILFSGTYRIQKPSSGSVSTHGVSM